MPKRRLDVEDEEMVRMYEDDGASLHAIADHFDVHRDVVRTRLVEAGVELRSKEEAYDLWLRGTYLPPECAAERCTMEPRGYNGEALELCTYHAKRALGLLGPPPGSSGVDPSSRSDRRRRRSS